MQNKRNLYRTAKVRGENVFVEILAFDPNEGHHGHYKIGKAVNADSMRVTQYNGRLSIPANRLERFTL